MRKEFPEEFSLLSTVKVKFVILLWLKITFLKVHFWDAGLLDDDSLAGGVGSQVLSYFHSIAITITIVKLWLTLSMTAGLICVKEVPQAPQLPNLHPWQPGRAPASCLQQPGGHHYH